MRRSCWPVLLSFCVACGSARQAEPTTPPTDTAPAADCDALRAASDEASRALASCREQTPAIEWAHRESFAWLDEHLGAHLVATREGGEAATTMVEVQEIAERVWTLLDEVREEASDRALLDRTEDATEALMREHDLEGRTRALAGLASALGALRADLEPSPGPTCEPEERAAATAWMSAQAQCRGLDDADTL